MNPLDLHVVAACAVPPLQPGDAVGLLAACTLEVPADQPFIRLIPAGEFHASRGALMGAGPWRLDAPLAAALIDRVRARGIPMPIDYEHQTLLAERNGLPAPAAGWIDPTGLEWREDGLYGPVTWTARAAAMLAAGEYRYLSPVFSYSAADGAVLDLMHASLTNQPAIDTESLHRAAARLGRPCSDPSKETQTMPDPIRAKLGVPEEADLDSVVSAIDALQVQAAQAAEQVAAAARGTAPDPQQFVPIAAHEEMVAALRTQLIAQGESALEREIAEGLADGSIPGPAMAERLRGLGLAACKEHRAAAVPIAALARTQTQGRAPAETAQGPALGAYELAVCKMMGHDPKDFLAAKAAAEEAS